MFDPIAIDAQLPKGVADFLPEQANKIGYIEARISRVFELWGFQRIITPLLEFQDVLSAGMGADLKERMFRFEDRYGNRLVAIPPDITPQVARIVATRMSGFPLPYRLWYVGRVLRHAEHGSGKSRELRQTGVELIGLDSPEADAEMIAMAIEVLKNLGFSDFKLDLGHIGFGRGMLDASGATGALRRRLEGAIGRKDLSELQEILRQSELSSSSAEELSALPRLFGGRDVLNKAREVVHNETSLAALNNLSAVIDILNIHGVTDQIAIDLGEMRGFNYHTGVTFEGFVPGLGESVCSGGRYDNLMAQYGAPKPATGFAFNILALLSALDHRPDVEASKTRDFLIFNSSDDRREALNIAQSLRHAGYTTARDIIRRDFEQSLAYARRMNIRWMLVIGDNATSSGEVVLVNTLDGTKQTVPQEKLLAPGFQFPAMG